MPRSQPRKSNSQARFSPMGRSPGRPQTRRCSHGSNSSAMRQRSPASVNAAATSHNASLSASIGAPPSPPPERPLPPLPPHASRPHRQQGFEPATPPPSSNVEECIPEIVNEESPVPQSIEQDHPPNGTAEPLHLDHDDNRGEWPDSGSWGLCPVAIPPETQDRLQQVGASSSCAHGQAPRAPQYKGQLKYRRSHHNTERAEEHEQHELVSAAYFPGVPFQRILYWQYSYGCVLLGGNGSHLQATTTMSTEDGGVLIPEGVSVAIFNTMARLVNVETIVNEEDGFVDAELPDFETMQSDSDDSDFEDIYDFF